MNLKEFNEIVDTLSDGLFTFLIKMTRNKEDAEDLMQEAYKRLWKNRKKVEKHKAKSFIFTVAYHLFIDYKRKISRFSNTENYEYYQQSYLMAQPDLADVINEALERLPDIQKTVLLLRDYEGYTYKEIATITGLNENQVKVYIFRARKAMRTYLVKPENVI